MALSPQDEQMLDRALALAALGSLVDPNPRVGCVLVRDEVVVGEGFHAGAGTAHAEAAALAQSGESARGATAFITLEPCTHVGRTPPCAQALIDAGVERVVFVAADPSERAGGGAALLREAGIAVEKASARFEQSSRALNEAWFFAVEHGRPHVTWKYATTLDGRIAAADGSSRWITEDASRADVHALRARSGAVVVGTGTALTDDPALTARCSAYTGHDPLRVVVGHRDLPADSRLLDGSAETVHLRTHDPLDVLARLHECEIRSVLIEGGPTLAAAFVRAGLVDRIVAYVAPALLGAGPAALADLGVQSMSQIRRFNLRQVDRFGSDVRLVLEPEGEI